MYHFRKNIEAISPYRPGKPVKEVERELGIKNSIKLASNENAWGFSPKSKTAMEDAIKLANIYPDSASFYLRQKISEFNKIPMENIVVGNGSNEILEIIMRTVLGENTNIVSSEYAFSIYGIIAQTCGATHIKTATKNYVPDIDTIIGACNDQTAIVIIDNPNNPTGSYVPYSEMKKLLDFTHKNKIMLIADEAYVEYVRAKDYKSIIDHFDRYENLVITRTFSKAYGLCGLRIGYGVGNKKIIDLAHKVRAPFNVNMISQYAGEAALGDQDFVNFTVKHTHEGIDYLYTELKELGIHCVPTQCNFIMFETPMDGKTFFDKLLRHGVIARPMLEYGLYKHIRLSVGTMDQNKKAVAAIREVINN
ncbi:MAG: histidinol-phosphate transaminase [bacterium]